jgi:hypothetical protein
VKTQDIIATREKCQGMYKGKLIKITTNLSAETLNPREQHFGGVRGGDRTELRTQGITLASRYSIA